MKKTLILFLLLSVLNFSNSKFSDLKWGDNKNTVADILGKETETEENELIFYNVWFEDIYLAKLALGFSNNKLIYWRGISNVDLDKLKGLAAYYEGKYKTTPFEREESDEVLVFKSVNKTNSTYFIIDKHRIYDNGTFDVIISDMNSEGKKVIEARADEN